MPKTVTVLGDGIEGLFIKDNRFSTTLLSFNFYLPLDRQTVAGYSLLPFLMTTGSAKYPDFSKLNYKLNKLYGATLAASAEKVGDLLLLKLSVSTIDDRYALDAEPLTEQAAQLLLDLIFEPNVKNGAFADEDVEREKRKAIEHIRSEFADKRLYAQKRLIEEMYTDSVYSTPKCGTEEQIAALSGKMLYECWQNLLKTALVRVHLLSSAMPANFFQKITARFEQIVRKPNVNRYCHMSTTSVGVVHNITEHMDLAQGKIAMGFSCDMAGNDLETAPLFVMSDLFGGGPYSRLFTNVREKLSLCYYCGASTVRLKGLLTVNSGVEAQNAERAKEEILKQLSIIQNGKFSDFELESSLKSLVDSLNAVSDSQASADNWYALKISNPDAVTPEEFAERVRSVSREDIIRAANGVRLHTVYQLLPKEK